MAKRKRFNKDKDYDIKPINGYFGVVGIIY